MSLWYQINSIEIIRAFFEQWSRFLFQCRSVEAVAPVAYFVHTIRYERARACSWKQSRNASREDRAILEHASSATIWKKSEKITSMKPKRAKAAILEHASAAAIWKNWHQWSRRELNKAEKQAHAPMRNDIKQSIQQQSAREEYETTNLTLSRENMKQQKATKPHISVRRR